MTVEQQITTGFAHHRAGRVAEAESLYREALTREPTHAEALYLLGTLALQTKRFDVAAELIAKALAVKSDFAQGHYNLALANLNLEKWEEAASAARRAISLRPRDADAHLVLGNALKSAGRIEEAVAAFGEAISIRPAYAEAYFNLGNALSANGQQEQAIAALRKAIELRPALAAAHLSLGLIFQEQRRFEEAAGEFKQAAIYDPNNPDVHGRLAMTLADLKRIDEAQRALDRAVMLAPDSARTHEARGTVLLRSGEGAKAVESFQRAIEIAPESLSSWINLGQALRQVGRFEEATRCAAEILALRPGAAEAYTILSGVGAGADAGLIAKLAQCLEDPRISISDRAELGFALGKILDEADRFDEAFEQYARANALTLDIRRAAGERYSSDVFGREVDELTEASTVEFFDRSRDWGERSELPVFVVGMPRSGTTLVEQIAASHPEVCGAGELKDIGNIAASLDHVQIGADAIRNAARKQLDRLRAIGGTASRVIDKMPANIMHLGLIAMLFPSARIILCRRDPRDTCLSCFFQRFGAGNLFAFELRDCGRHHVHTDRLIAHWLKVLPVRMLEVRYEELVANLEGQSQRIIEFLGLPWNPACLEFHKTERTVQTASAWQVRQPIYTRSVGRWKNYEKHLPAMMEGLGLRT